MRPLHEDGTGWDEQFDPQAPQSSKAYGFLQYVVVAVAGLALAAWQDQLDQPAVVAMFGVIAGSMFIAGLWLEHRSYRFGVDAARVVLMLSAGLWLPLLSDGVEQWMTALQWFGTANAVLLIGLFAFQRTGQDTDQGPDRDLDQEAEGGNPFAA
jgi:hypothetical protein